MKKLSGPPLLPERKGLRNGAHHCVIGDGVFHQELQQQKKNRVMEKKIREKLKADLSLGGALNAGPLSRKGRHRSPVCVESGGEEEARGGPGSSFSTYLSNTVGGRKGAGRSGRRHPCPPERKRGRAAKKRLVSRLKE